MRAKQLVEAEMGQGTLVIHLADRSTDFLSPIYAGKGYPVVTGAVSRPELHALMQKYSRLYMLGHGSPSGLFARNFLIDDEFGEEIASKRDGLYIWCNADAYAKRNGLSGLVSGMFVSEVGEARMFGIEATQKEVDFSNDLFSATVRAVLDEGAPPSAVRERYSHATSQIVKFNNERLYVFEQGNPTPALHATSLAHPPKEPEWGAKRFLKNAGKRLNFQEWMDQVEYEAFGESFQLWDVLEHYGIGDDELFDVYLDGIAPKDFVAQVAKRTEEEWTEPLNWGEPPEGSATEREGLDDNAPERFEHRRL